MLLSAIVCAASSVPFSTTSPLSTENTWSGSILKTLPPHSMNSNHTSPEHSNAPASWPARVIVGLIRSYQVARTGRLSPCRFEPSCSEYTRLAVTTHGAVKGIWLGVRRIVRCRPGGPVGFDPVPPVVEKSDPS